MPTTYSVLMHHIVRGSSLFDKTSIAEIVSNDLGQALSEAYERSRTALSYLPEGEITLFVMTYPPMPAKPTIILDCSVSYDLLFV